MQTPVQVTFRDVPVSDAVEARCWEEAEKLNRYYDRIMGCRVVIAAPHRHHLKGRLYSIKIDLTVPGGELVVNRDQHEKHAHEDVYVSIRDAFNRARRQLEDFARRQRGEVKHHETPLHGRVRALVHDEDHGFIETHDGQELYFHRNSVLEGGFDQLEIGTQVRFVEEAGDQGPQASSVVPVGRHSRFVG